MMTVVDLATFCHKQPQKLSGVARADTAHCLQSYWYQSRFLSSPPPTTEFSVHPTIGLSIQDGRRDPPSPSPPLSWDLVVPSGFPLDFWSIQVDPSSKLKFLSPHCEISISPTQIKKFRKLISWYETYQSNNETLLPLCTISSLQRRIHFQKSLHPTAKNHMKLPAQLCKATTTNQSQSTLPCQSIHWFPSISKRRNKSCLHSSLPEYLLNIVILVKQ